jgi:hypothetical protein
MFLDSSLIARGCDAPVGEECLSAYVVQPVKLKGALAAGDWLAAALCVWYRLLKTKHIQDGICYRDMRSVGRAGLVRTLYLTITSELLMSSTYLDTALRLRCRRQRRIYFG